MKFICKKLIFSLLPAFAGFLIVTASGMNPDLTENVYSRHIFPLLTGFLGSFTSLFPFSLAELIQAGMIISVILMILYLFLNIKKRKDIFSGFTKNTVFYCLGAASSLYFLFCLLCAPNYYRYSFTTYSGLTIKSSSATELAGLCSELIGQANLLRSQVDTDENGVMRLSTEKTADTMQAARKAYESLSERYTILSASRSTPKPFAVSQILSYLNLSGYYFPYTGEANINVDMPDQEIPFAACHELAHTSGFMREDEANFISYLACHESKSADIRYSGVLLALIYSTNALYDTDQELYFKTVSSYSQGLITDLRYSSDFWKRHQGKPAEVSNAVNNAYLKMNKQSDGVQSYGRMVDLLLADYRSRMGIT